MCGIFGVWNWDDKPIDLPMIEYATTRIRHRGPDDEGYALVSTSASKVVVCGGQDTNPQLDIPSINCYLGESFNVGLGFRRLSILDLSPSGHQPMNSIDSRFWIVFNGEIFNYLELKDELYTYGYKFRSGTDTEVIIAAYQHWGVNCLNHFNGMWAFAIWDQQMQHLFMARDRFGIKPLFYTQDNHTFAFASEIKALVGQAGLIQFNPNTTAIFNYLLGGRQPSSRTGETFFNGIKSLPPGHWLLVKPYELLLHRYWHLPVTTLNFDGIDVAEAVEEYRQLFVDSVRLRLRSDVPVGTCLSGGLDSSAIVCAMNRLKKQNAQVNLPGDTLQKTFSAVYESNGRYNERPYIDKVLQSTGVEGNFVIPSGERLRQDIERLVWHQEEPFISTSMFAQWCVMSIVRDRGVKVVLDGQGADEVLGGYRPYARYLADLISKGWLRMAANEVVAIKGATNIASNRILFETFRQQVSKIGGANPWLQQAATPFWKKTIYNRAVASGLHKDFVVQQQPGLPVDWQIGSSGSLLGNYLSYAVEESSLPQLLRYEDRNAMAFGIENRVPFLDYRLVKFSFEKGLPYSIRQGWTKWILRQAMVDLVPQEILWRKDKVAFATPESEWLKEWTQLYPDFFGKDALTREYLNLKIVNKYLSSSASLDQNGHLLWRWINMELWLKLWNSA